jgi:hypothetical protein
VKTPLGNLPNERHPRTFKDQGRAPTRQLPLPLVTATGRFAPARAWSATNPQPPAILVNAPVDVVEFHVVFLNLKSVFLKKRRPDSL